MKNRLLLTACTLSLLLTACKGKKEGGFFETVETLSNIKKIADEGEKLEKRIDALEKMAPISKDKIKAFLPETIGDFKRTSLSVGSPIMAGVTMGDANYKNEDARISISMIDGAGKGSVLISGIAVSISMDFENEDEYKLEKSDKIDGHRVIVTSTKYDNTEESSISTVINDRFQIILDGKNVSLKKLKTIFKKLNLKVLK